MLSLESHNHADSYLVPIVEDMAEIGIQVWQGVLPENDIPALQQKLHGRLVLMGGMGAAIDRTDAAPEEIYGYAMDTLRRCCPGGHYIPSITYGLPGAVYPHVDEYIDRAIADYNRALHVPRFDLPSVPRRVRAVAVRQAAGAAVENGDVLARLAAALEKGQQIKALALCREHEACCFFSVYDAPRPDSAGIVGEPQKTGLSVLLVTGDAAPAANAVAEAVGISEVLSSVLPYG